jgi:hypothetical protein
VTAALLHASLPELLPAPLFAAASAAKRRVIEFVTT